MPKVESRVVPIPVFLVSLLALTPVGTPAQERENAAPLAAVVARTAVDAAPTSPSPADSTSIRATALDYIEGWYEADAERMERALHPHLAKRFLEPLPGGGVRLTDTSALELVQQVRAGGGSSVPVAERRTDVTILDVFEDVASVRVDAHGWIDYMHLARAGGEWRIVNVLWEPRGPPADPAGPGGA